MKKRNVGKEILDGIREIKRGEYGRVTVIKKKKKKAKKK